MYFNFTLISPLTCKCENRNLKDLRNSSQLNGHFENLKLHQVAKLKLMIFDLNVSLRALTCTSVPDPVSSVMIYIRLYVVINYTDNNQGGGGGGGGSVSSDKGYLNRYRCTIERQ